MNKTIKNKVMEKIEKNEIKMRPKWQFEAEYLGSRGLIVFLLLGATLMLTFLIYLIEINTPMELFAFGEAGRTILIRDFPYLLLGATIVLGVGGGVLYSKTGRHYKKTAVWILLMTTAILIILATLLTVVRIRFNLNQYLGL